MIPVKDTTGLWVYRFAFVFILGLCLWSLEVLFQARFTWYPSYEEKLLARMKQIEDSVGLPPKPDAKAKTIKRHVRRHQTVRR